MYTRVVRCSIKPGAKGQFDRALNTQVIPELVAQAGLADAVMLYQDTDSNQFVSITFWVSKDTAERYGREVYPRLIYRLESFCQNITVQSFNVETSSIHHVVARKAA